MSGRVQVQESERHPWQLGCQHCQETAERERDEASAEAEALAEALEAVNLVNPPAALREYRARHPKETP